MGTVLLCDFAPLRELLAAFLLFVFFNEPQRSREEIELFTQSVLDITCVGKMQSRLAARGEQHKRRRSHSNLSQILNFQSRVSALPRRWSRSAARLGDCPFEEVVQLRGRDTPVARLVSFQDQRQDSIDSLARQG